MMKKILLGTILLTALGLLAYRQSHHPEPTTVSGQSMGTSWHLRSASPEKFAALIQQELDTIENALSTWNENSELCRYNRGEIDEPSAILSEALALAGQFEIQTDGKFTPHILRAVSNAGFAPKSATTVHQIDLSAMAKGYAVDRVRDCLRAAGLHDFVFELGGEIFASGCRPDGSPWKVVITNPHGGIGKIITLHNQALATSGNQYQIAAVSDDGQIASHLIDPATGKPIQRPLSSVSVIAEDCVTADAWATAAFIAGPQADLPVTTIWQ